MPIRSFAPGRPGAASTCDGMMYGIAIEAAPAAADWRRLRREMLRCGMAFLLFPLPRYSGGGLGWGFFFDDSALSIRRRTLTRSLSRRTGRGEDLVIRRFGSTLLHQRIPHATDPVARVRQLFNPNNV